MDDLNKLLFDLQESQPTLPSNGHSATLIKELDVIETQLSSKKKMVSNAPLTSIPRPRPTDISNSIERLKQAKVSSEKTLDSTSKAKLCEDCKQPIVRGGSILNGKSYHQEHFVCNICRKSLKGVLVFNKDGKLWCEKDYHKAYSPECFFCKEPIKEVRVSQHQDNGIEAVGKSFHPDHFFCAQCGISLINQTFIEYQGKVRYVFMKAFCSDDYATLFATRCAHCLQPLLEDYITAISKNYHKDHFICSVRGMLMIGDGVWQSVELEWVLQPG